MLLEGRCAFVTGAGSGIGRAVAERFAAEGAAVAVADLNPDSASLVAQGLRDRGHRACEVGVDVTSEASVERAVAEAEERLGNLDVGVASAGIWLDRRVVGHPLSEWERMLAINLSGVWLTLRALATHMAERGGPGRLIAISSVAGKRGAPGRSAYAAAKFGVIGVIESLAKELGRQGITVNAICPGDIETPMGSQVVETFARNRGVPVEEMHRAFGEGTALGRIGTPDEVAKVALFLASDLGSYMTGASVVVDGGLTW